MTLHIQHLAATSNERLIFPPQSMEIIPGQCLLVRGANGCGKSTFLRLLAGLKKPAAGSFDAPAQTHYLGHHNSLRPTLTVRENLHLAAMVMGNQVQSGTLNHILQQAGLLPMADSYAGDLSAGQARRLAIARLLITPAALWLLDEPATALDAAGKTWLSTCIDAHCHQGGMVVMSTHEPQNDHTPTELQLTALPPAGQTVSDLSYTQSISGCDKARLLPLLWILLKYDLLQTFRNRAAWLTPLLFFSMVIVLFPLAVGPDPVRMHTMAGGMIWVTALLSLLLSIDHVFRPDRQSGWLDLLLTGHCPLTLSVSAKILSHWISYGLPLTLLSPLFAILFNLSTHETIALLYSLLAGMPILSLTGAIGAALTAGIRGQALLLPVLMIPLYIPTLIFGTGCMTAAGLHQPIAGPLAMLGALLLFTLTFAPLLTGAGLRTGAQ